MSESRSAKESLTSVRRGPGERIRLARVKAGHDIEWAAAQMRLRKSVIEALETNDYDNLPPPVFIQGYLRTYSDILSLPQEEVLAEYRASVAPRTPDPVVAPAADKKKPAGAKEKKEPVVSSRPEAEDKTKLKQPVPAVNPMAKAEMASTALSPKQPQAAEVKESRQQPVQGGKPPPASQADVVVRDVPVVEQQPVVKHSPALEPFGLDRGKSDKARVRSKRKPRSRLPRPSIALPPRHVLARWGLSAMVVLLIGLLLYWGIGQLGKIRIRSPETVIQNLQQQWNDLFGGDEVPAIPLPQGYQAPSGSLPLQVPPIQPLSEDAQLLDATGLTDSLYDPTLEAAAALGQQADTGTPKPIQLEMLGTSWVEVEDSTGTYRLVGELKKGAFHEFGGSPPYRVLFGRSNMVQLYVDGQPYDFSRLQQGAVARFSLNP